MSHGLPPIESVEDSLEAYLNPLSRKSRALYVTILVLLCGGIALLPIVRVDVSVQSDGIIRSVAERHEIVAAISGYVERVDVRENEVVHAGQALFSLATATIESRRALVARELLDIEAQTGDLEFMDKAAEGSDLSEVLQTGRNSTEYRLFREELGALDLAREHARREADRSRDLATQGLAPVADVENAAFNVTRIEGERAALIQRYRAGWRARLEELSSERSRLLERLTLLDEDSSQHVVRAPIAGTIGEMTGVSPGSFVQAGQTLGVISPDGRMIAEVFVSPADIGLLEVGTPARLMIDAFNYADWGALAGTISELPNDYDIVNGRPVFRTSVALADTELTLKSGVSRGIRRGMTLRARFTVANRSLWQLLRDDVNNWLNPIQRPG